jgi:hypothetical protein
MANYYFQKQTLRIIILGILVSLCYFGGGVKPVRSEVTWPAIEIDPYLSGFSSPVHIANAKDSSNRLFVVERAGVIHVVKNGVVSTTPFLGIQDRVQSTGGEEGLLSMAFPPDYASKGYFYVYYTNKNGDNQVSRFYLSDDVDVADPTSEELIINFSHPVHANHNGGQIAFGPDGFLYIATGDGGGGGDPDENGQNPASLLGKILRIDVEFGFINGTYSHEIYLPMVMNENNSQQILRYRIPTENPFVDTEGYRGEIWALGLRNPWRFSFDRTLGDLFIADVGQSSWEEVNFQSAKSNGGENYGWNEMEGEVCYLPNCDLTGKTSPLFVYQTHVDGSCSVTGGFIYRGIINTGMSGIYFFGDYCNGRITGLQFDGTNWYSQVLLDTDVNISTFGEDESGELYLADITSGTIYQIVELD